MSKEISNQDIMAILAEVVSKTVGPFETMDALLDRIASITMKTLNAEVCSIFQRKEDNHNVIKCTAGSGFAKNIVGIAEYEMGEGFTGTVFKLGNEYNIRDRQEGEKLVEQTCSHSMGDKSPNLLALPLKIKDDIFGVIKVENKIGANSFTEDDLTIFRIIANVIAMAIENARLSQKAEDQAKLISNTLNEVASAVVGRFNRKDLLNEIIETSMKTLNAEVCSIFLRKEDSSDTIECVAGVGFAKNIVGIAEYKIGEGLTGNVVKLDKEFNIKIPQDSEVLKAEGIWTGKFDDIQWRDGKTFQNLLALPLKIKGEILGVIKAENKIGDDYFTEDDLIIFRTIANVIALTIKNTRLHKQIEKQLKAISAKAAHRINNQVTNYDYIELKLEDEAKKLIPSRKELSSLSQRIGKTTAGLKEMARAFTSFGKPIELKKSLGKINDIIQEEIDILSLSNNNIQINFKCDSKIPVFYLDKTHFAESVKELLKNSKRAIKETGKPGNINIKTNFYEKKKKRGIKEFIEIIIEDDGPGFPNNIPIYEPFHSTHPKGTGLGLATVKELIEAHGGTIELIPKGESKGVCFKILIPIDKKEK